MEERAPDPASDATLPADPSDGATLTADRGSARGLGGPSTALVAERYTLLGEIGRGGGGCIVVAMDRRLHRKVALKRPLDRGGSARLEREALVMARLEHPSIVPVHDAGLDVEGTPYYAMKLLGGSNFSDRIAATSTFDARLGLLRIVGAVCDAMAYAHAQQVIHRDLKPSNVIVGEFGEVAVIDWGLAKVIGELDEDAPRDVTISAELTGHGDVLGTPAYMAPEQAIGHRVDARADVYAIGAILYQVLCGELPYGRLHGAEQLSRLIEGPPPPLERREPRVPAELAAIVAQAMARDPAARYPSARELADDLHRYEQGRLVAAHRYSPWTRARRWLGRHRFRLAAGVAAAAVVAAIVLGVRARPGAAPSCDGARARIDGAFDDPRRTAIAAAFAASKLPFAADTWQRIEPRLDAYRDDWVAMSTEACKSTRVEGRQSEALLDLRSACLERRRDELDALVDQLTRADDNVIQRAVSAVGGLSRIADCGDVDALLARSAARRGGGAPPEAEQARLAAIKEAFGVGRYQDALDAGETLVIDASLDPATRAEGFAWMGRIQNELGDPNARTTLTLAMRTSSAAGEDKQAALAACDLVAVLDINDQKYDQAAVAADVAEALVARADDDEARSDLMLVRGDLLDDTGHYDDAYHEYQAGLDIIERRFPGDPVTGAILTEMGSNRREAGDDATARTLFERARVVFEQQLGPTHPKVGQLLNNFGNLAFDEGDYLTALDDFRRSVAIKEPVYGASSAQVANTVQNVGNCLLELGRIDEAAPLYERSFAIFTLVNGPAHPRTAGAMVNLAVARAKQGRFDEALALAKGAIAIRTKALGADSDITQSSLVEVADVELIRGEPADLADAERVSAQALVVLTKVDGAEAPSTLDGRVLHDQALMRLGHCDQAIPDLETMIPSIERNRGHDSLTLTAPLTYLGRCLVEQQRAADALPLLQRAATIARAKLDAGNADPTTLASVNVELARAIWDSGGDRTHAVELVDAAIPVLTRPDLADDRTRALAWHASHRL